MRFDLYDVSKDISAAMDASAQVDLTKAKGYKYFQDYLDTTSTFTATERALIKSLLPQLRDWYAQAGVGGMDATDTMNRGAFMLSGSSADTLTGTNTTGWMRWRTVTATNGCTAANDETTNAWRVAA